MTKVVLITGGSRGIGLATAKKISKTSSHLILASRSDENLRSAKQQILLEQPQAQVDCHALDIKDEVAVKDLFQYIHSTYSRLDVLINCAGILYEHQLSMTTSAALKKIFSVNLFGTYFCSQYASRLMAKNKKGAIVNISSISGEAGIAGQSAYSASKSAISGLTHSLAKELAIFNVRVNAVSPGFIITDMTRNYDRARKDQVISKTALLREGQPEEVAELICFLASEQASYITGQVIHINGGLQL